MFLLAVFLLIIFSVFWKIIISKSNYGLFVDGERLCQKNLRFSMTEKKYNMVYSLSIMVLQFK